jgi:hypothetical protein
MVAKQLATRITLLADVTPNLLPFSYPICSSADINNAQML